MADESIPAGSFSPQNAQGEFAQLDYLTRQSMSRLNTATLVKVIKCTNNGALAPVGYVDVQPLVNQVDNQGNPTPLAPIYNIPYVRLQGGANAVIIDPVVGDIGIAVFASRDISRVKTTRAQDNPGSKRQYSLSDALYIGGCLNAAPVQYIQFSAAGITIHSPTQVHIEAPTVLADCSTLTANTSTTTINASSATINAPNTKIDCSTCKVTGNLLLGGTLVQTGEGGGGGACTLIGPLTVQNEVTANGIRLSSHVHGGVQPGGSTTSIPQ